MGKAKKAKVKKCTFYGIEFESIDASTLKLHLISLGILSLMTKLLVFPVTTHVFQSFVDLFDIGIYLSYASNIVSGQIPYIDFIIEYPPLFLLPVILPMIPTLITQDPFTYVYAYQTLMAGVDILTVFLVYFIGLKLFDSSKKALLAGALYATAFASSYFVMTKYDAFPTFLLILGIFLVMHRSQISGYIAIFFGFFSKIFPIISAPYLILYGAQYSSIKKEVSSFAKLCLLFGLVLVVPLALINPEWYAPYLFAAGAKTAVYANTITNTVHAFVAVVLGFNISIQTVSHVMTAIMITLIFLLFLISCVCGVNSPRRLIGFTGATLLTIILFTKFHSPQYIVWVTPFFALLFAESYWKIVLYYIIQIITYIEFPLAWGVLYVNAAYVSEVGTTGWYEALVFFTLNAIVFLVAMLTMISSDTDLKGDVQDLLEKIRTVVRLPQIRNS